MKKCASCGSLIVFGMKAGENHYCDEQCLEHHKYPGFCKECISETTDESTGGTAVATFGVGTALFGRAAKCPICHSVIKRKWFLVLFVPVVPLHRFRIKPVTSTTHFARRLPEVNLRESQLRVAGEARR